MTGIWRIIGAGFLFGAALAVAGCTNTPGSALEEAIPVATDAPAIGFDKIEQGTEQHFILRVGRRVYFDAGSAQLDPIARETLDLQAAWLNQHPDWLVKLQGFADDPGSHDANVRLSAERAKAVMDYLAAQGVDPDRMWAKGYGTDRPVRNCPEIDCKVQNRRVVVNLRREFDAAAPQYVAKQS